MSCARASLPRPLRAAAAEMGPVTHGRRFPACPARSRRHTARIASVLLTASWIAAACTAVRQPTPQAVPPPSPAPPAGLTPEEVPLFVCFGSDDNGYSGVPGSGSAGGLHFLTELFAGRRNSSGVGNAATFDGAPLRYSFYVNSRYITTEPGRSAYGEAPREQAVWVRRAWKEAVEAGHEIGNHTHSHPHGRELTVGQWEAEIRRCTEILVLPYAADDVAGSQAGLGVTRAQLPGFRTPFLEYTDATLTAAQNQGFAYDCSLEEGTQDDQDGRDFVWPYQLDRGSPANPSIGPHPGLWEIPVYVFIVPPDAACSRLGVPPGLHEALKARQPYFDTATGKVTGMDWNLWCEYRMTPAEFLATIRYTLELRVRGNRAPLTIGLHSELYSDRQPVGECAASAAERRAALVELVDRLQNLEYVRIVSAHELLEWLRHPAPLRDASQPGDRNADRLGHPYGSRAGGVPTRSLTA